MSEPTEHRRYEASAPQGALRPACSCGWVGIACPAEDGAAMIFAKHQELFEQLWGDSPATGA